MDTVIFDRHYLGSVHCRVGGMDTDGGCYHKIFLKYKSSINNPWSYFNPGHTHNCSNLVPSLVLLGFCLSMDICFTRIMHR